MPSSFAQFRWALKASAAVATLMLAACASLPPPTSELANARQAVTRAGNADAQQYAGEDYGQAQSMLAQAQSAMASGRDDDARRLALTSAAHADLANARSREAVANTELAQKRAEIADLQQRLQVGDGQ